MAGLMFLVVPVTIHGMTEPSKAEIAALVQRRMDTLRITAARLGELTGVDKNTVRDFLAGKRRLQAENRLKFDDALRWEPGSLRRIYEGGEPMPLPDAAEPLPLRTISDDELAAEFLRRMREARHAISTNQTATSGAPGETIKAKEESRRKSDNVATRLNETFTAFYNGVENEEHTGGL